MSYNVLINKNNKIDENFYNNVLTNLIEINYSRSSESYYMSPNHITDKIYLEKKTLKII